MNLSSGKLKTVLLIIAFFSLFSTVAADSNWTVERKSSLSMDTVSVNETTIQVLNITADVSDKDIEPSGSFAPTPLDPEDIEDSSNLTFTYNKTKGTAKDLKYWRNGLWYASFDGNSTRGGEVLYSANGTIKDSKSDDIDDSNQTANITNTLNLGNYTVELQNDYSVEKKAGRKFKMEVSVTNVSDGDEIDDSIANVQVVFKNNTNQESTQIENYGDGRFFNSEVAYPDNPGSSYIMHVTAEAEDSYANGSTSRIVDIAPQVQGQLDKFYSEDGCSKQSMVEKCEQNATVDIEYGITSSQAENVNMSIYAFNNSGRHMVKTANLTDEGGLFTGQTTVPDLNTSKYMKEMEFVFNATNNYRTHVDRENITLKFFKIQDRSPPTTYIGQNYELDIFLGKPYSLNSYSPDRFKNITVNITDSNSQHVQTFNKGDLSYSETSGVMEASLLLDESNPTGSYSLDIKANNTYGESKTQNSGFSVRDVGATFEAEDDVEWSVNRLEPTNFMIEIENLLQSSNELDYEVTELEDQLEVTNETLELDGGETGMAEVEVNLTTLEDEEGSIKFMDTSTNYDQTVDIEIDAPNCQIQAGDICSETSSVNSSTTGTGNYTETLELRYIGEKDSSATYNTTVEGNIGAYLSVQDQGTEATISGQKDITLTFDPSTTGTFTGNIIFDTGNNELAVPVELIYSGGNDQNDDTQDTGTNPEFSVSPSSVDLGTVVDGEQGTASIDITNDGEVEITSITADSSTYTVSTDTTSISTGGSATATLTFTDVSSSSGTAEITAESSGGEATETVSVTASPIQNYGEMTSDLRDQLRNLQRTAPSEYQSDLTEASTQISQVETAWDAGNYQEAKDTYQDISDTLNSVESETTTTPEPGSGGENQNNGGGLPILPIVAGTVFLFLVIGFIVYTSYIPEKGDPLYSVLGEQQ